MKTNIKNNNASHSHRLSFSTIFGFNFIFISTMWSNCGSLSLPWLLELHLSLIQSHTVSNQISTSHHNSLFNLQATNGL